MVPLLATLAVALTFRCGAEEPVAEMDGEPVALQQPRPLAA